jgi:hypothetical protein
MGGDWQCNNISLGLADLDRPFCLASACIHPPVPHMSHLQGKPAPLKSSFKLSYYTMLNFLRRREAGDLSMETVIRKSFQQFQQERSLPKVRGWVVLSCVMCATAQSENHAQGCGMFVAHTTS